MAFDGITIAAMVKELHLNLDGGRFNKIAQPEADELLITGKGANGQCRLLLSASASLPLIYFTSKNKPSPMTAPNFCMLLRKHIGSARVLDIRQPGMERVVMFELEHLNELGDPCKKVLIMELMGKHSNIIFCDDKGMILDSIKHVSSHMSSVREVLPGREYFIPKTQDKLDPLTVSEEEFCDVVCRKPCNVSRAVYSSLTGISPVVAEEICFRASIDGSDAAQSLDEAARVHLYHTFRRLMDQVVEGDFSPNIVYRGEEPVEYGDVVMFELEHLNELGDPCKKVLIMELMGKHSNIIFCDDKGMILDSIKHVSSHMSSVREVLPGREYFIPKTQDKLDPLTVSEEEFCDVVCRKPCNVSRAVYSSLTGISPVVAEEICFRASIDGSDAAQSLDEAARVHLYHTFRRLMDQVVEGDFSPNIVYRGEEPVEYGVFAFQQYGPEYHSVEFESVSQMLETYYATKNTLTRIHQKSSDLRRIVQTALERNRKKLSLQEKQMKDTAKKEKYKVYGELINTYGYGLEDGCKSFKALNYYTNEEITIPLDPTMTPAENSKKYFDKYGKLKRTEEALTEQIADTRSEIEHLESVSNALDIALAESDLAQIKEELMEYGYIKKHYDRRKGQKAQSKSKPFHYVTEDGYDIYVGKNNFQNDELTFKFATGNDWWFHAKKMAGSHVVVKSKDGELPDHIFEIAGQLAAYYSKGRTAPKVEIDYIQKKQVKKPAGAKPGFVVYYTNYSLMAEPSLKGVREV